MSTTDPRLTDKEWRHKLLSVDTREIVTVTIIERAEYEEPKWAREMWTLASPWHIKRRWQVEIGFKLLAVARGESLKGINTISERTRVARLSSRNEI